MSTLLVALVFGVAFGLAVFLLYRFRRAHWYWHILSLIVAMALGLMPGDAVPAALRSYAADMSIGFVIIFLLVWGLGGLIYPWSHRERHA